MMPNALSHTQPIFVPHEFLQNGWGLCGAPFLTINIDD